MAVDGESKRVEPGHALCTPRDWRNCDIQLSRPPCAKRGR